MWQVIVVCIIVGVALVLVGRNLYMSFTGKGKICSCSCGADCKGIVPEGDGGCPSKRDEGDNTALPPASRGSDNR